MLVVAGLSLLLRRKPTAFSQRSLQFPRQLRVLLATGSLLLGSLFVVYIITNVAFAFSAQAFWLIGADTLSFGLPVFPGFGALAFLTFGMASLLMFLALSNRGIGNALKTTISFYSAPLLIVHTTLLLLFDGREMWLQATNFLEWFRLGGYSSTQNGVVSTVYGVPVLSNVSVAIITGYFFLWGLRNRK